MKSRYSVYPVDLNTAKPFIMRLHYAHRMPSVSYCYGLFCDGVIVGCITYGKPASPHLCVGVCGKEYSQIVCELNRLALLNSGDNRASVLISKSLKLLPKPAIIVSYADSGVGHIGYVYQSTNWLYTGMTDEGRKHPRTDRTRSNYHGRHQKDQSVPLRYRSQKHRYIYFLGSKKQKKEMLAALNYKIKPYPKGESRRYHICKDPVGARQVLMFE
jgi:hypothetical protein